MWANFMTLEYVNYIWWGFEQSKNIHVLFIHLGCDIWKLGWSYTPDTVKRNHCSSHQCSHETLFIWCYSLKRLFIAALSLKTPTLFTILLLFVWELSIICTSVTFVKFFSTLPC